MSDLEGLNAYMNSEPFAGVLKVGDTEYPITHITIEVQPGEPVRITGCFNPADEGCVPASPKLVSFRWQEIAGMNDYFDHDTARKVRAEGKPDPAHHNERIVRGFSPSSTNLTMEEFKPWLDQFDSRSQRLIERARDYARNPYGEPNHQFWLVVARMADLLDPTHRRRLDMAIRTTQARGNHAGKYGPFRQHALTHQFCQGVGVELGAAAHNPFGLEGAINVAPQDDFEFYKQAQIDFSGSYAEVDVWGEADSFEAPAPLDYIVSSHVVEHIPDLIGAFRHWNELLNPGGVVVMIFPKRTALPSDAGRQQTSFSRATNQTPLSL